MADTPRTGSTGPTAFLGSQPAQGFGVAPGSALSNDPEAPGLEVYTLGSQLITAWPTTITHNLHNVNAKLTGAYGVHVNGWYVKVTVLSKASDTMVLSGDVPPPAGGAVLDWRVQDT